MVVPYMYKVNKDLSWIRLRVPLKTWFQSLYIRRRHLCVPQNYVYKDLYVPKLTRFLFRVTELNPARPLGFRPSRTGSKGSLSLRLEYLPWIKETEFKEEKSNRVSVSTGKYVSESRRGSSLRYVSTVQKQKKNRTWEIDFMSVSVRHRREISTDNRRLEVPSLRPSTFLYVVGPLLWETDRTKVIVLLLRTTALPP